MPLARLPVPFDHPDWLFELKYDGFRALAYVDHGQVRMVSLKRNIYKSFSGLCNGIASELAERTAVLDGEIVYLDGDGRPQFYSLLRRRGPQQFAAFDLLWLDGRDLRMLPLVERKRRLRGILHGSNCLLYVDHLERTGSDFHRVACDHDLEGIVAKRKDGMYTPEATTWVKIKNPYYSQAEGRRQLFEKRARGMVG
jgi:bifunctional non-homologous end joining protein LigD